MRRGVILLLLAGCTARPVDDGRRCATEADCATVHPAGIADPNSPDFHSNLIVSLGYDLGLCTKCHGSDWAGGTAGKSCLRCHEQGPTTCTTCHAQPPQTGAHQRHTRFDCTACHVKPVLYTDSGHLFASDGSVIKEARVTFGDLARTDQATPSFSQGTCSGVYCHGGTLKDSAASHTTPAWNGGASEAACGTCHGKPPAKHAGRPTQCSLCHTRVIDDSGTLRDNGMHVDGKISLGDDSGSCLACHPSPGGAHAAHTGAPHRVTSPIACSQCHRVPSQIDSPGHFDHPLPEVFPAEAGPLVRTGGAQPTWDVMSESCTVYCHGPTTRSWNGGPEAAECGACHAIPPKDAAHPSTTQLTDCHNCHRTVDATGALQSQYHINGVVDGP